MKVAQRLLLVSALGFIPAAAQAADLLRAIPHDYVRVCAVHGPGFFYIPGSQTCIRIGGRARFEYVLSNTFARNADPSSFRALARIVLDARTQTEWGLLRADIRVEFTRDSGTNWFGSGNGARAGTKFSFVGPAGTFPTFSGADTVGNRLRTGLSIPNAFVQWGGLTAGRVQSFFDFYAGNDTWFGIADSKVLTQALAYTYTFGSGFSATLSIEDPKERQLNPIAGSAPIEAGGILEPSRFPGPGSPFSNHSPRPSCLRAALVTFSESPFRIWSACCVLIRAGARRSCRAPITASAQTAPWSSVCSHRRSTEFRVAASC
jgi:hypothetical protein